MDAYACTWLFTVYFGIQHAHTNNYFLWTHMHAHDYLQFIGMKAVYINNHMYIYIQYKYIYSLTKLVYWNVCKFEFKLKKTGGGDWGGARSASPPKQIGNTYFHMQGAWLNVILKLKCIYYTTCTLETCGM